MIRVWRITKKQFAAMPDHVLIGADIPDEEISILVIPESTLPSGWRSDPSPAEAQLRDIGTNWLKSLASPVLRVPATTIAGDFTYLLNPAHPDFPRIITSAPQPFTFDPTM